MTSTLWGLRPITRGADGLDAERFSSFYPESAAGVLVPGHGEKLYRGQNVAWIGQPGRMLKVDPAYVVGLEGNIFDPEKLRSVVAFIRRTDEPVVMRPGYGYATKIDIDDVIESQQYARHEGLERPLSAGDEDLDRWLADPSVVKDWDFPYSEDELEDMKAEAVREGYGDIGKFRFSIRDGHHRTIGALLAGEPFAWMRLERNAVTDGIEEVVGNPRKTTRSPRFR